jgi:hypothetical protein
MDALVYQAGLADASFSHERHHLPVARYSALQGLLQRYQLRLPPHEGDEPPRDRRLQALPNRTGPHQLIDLHAFHQALDREGA